MIGEQTQQRMLGFCEHLRHAGMIIGMAESADAMRLLESEGLTEHNHVRHVFRVLSCCRPEDWQRFDQLFDEYWLSRPMERSGDSAIARIDPRRRRTPTVTGLGTGTDAFTEYGDLALKGSGAGRQQTISRADFRFLRDRRAMRQVELLAERLAQSLRHKRMRRREVRAKGDRLELRKTFRRSLATAGFPSRPLFSRRIQMPPNIVILHDVSHSMEWNNPLLFRFSRGMVRAFANADIYVFHTRLFRATDYFRLRSVAQMADRLEENNSLWMGGTCIAASVRQFLDEYSATALNPRTQVLLISDGYDTDEETELNAELTTLRTRCRQLLWLNPMLGRTGVKLDAQQMTERYSAVDRFLSANSLAGLRETVREMQRALQS